MKALRWGLPIVLAAVHFSMLATAARQKVIGTYETETDFYQYYAPDAERIAAGRFPECPYQGPGYASLVAFVSSVTGDPLTSGTWISVVSAVVVGLLTFLLVGRLFGYWSGIAAQVLVPVITAMPAVSVSAMTDLPFLALCLATLLVVVSGDRAVVARAIAAGVLAGAAYLVRYNGIFLIVACVFGIGAIDLFNRPRLERLRLTAVALAAFVLTISPWLYANYTHRGSPFYNLNYLNVAIEFYNGSISQDGTRDMAARFHSIREVVAADPTRMVAHYLTNLAGSLVKTFTELANWWIGLPALCGVIVALARRPSKPLQLLLASGALYIMMMALSHWETRYYLFMLVIDVGLACYAFSLVVAAARNRGLVSRPFVAIISTVLLTMACASLVVEAKGSVGELLRDQPVELLEARQVIARAGRVGTRLVARKPHLPYITRQEWVFFPVVASADELRVWLTTNAVDYVLIGPAEVIWRPAMASLRDPRVAAGWLRPVWVSRNGAYVLYAPAFAGGF